MVAVRNQKTTHGQPTLRLVRDDDDVPAAGGGSERRVYPRR